MQILLILAMLTVPVISADLSAAESVIVNPKCSAVALSEDEIRALFLGRRTAWEDGSRVVLVVLKDGGQS